MAILVNNIKTPISAKDSAAFDEALRLLKVSSAEIRSIKLYKKSLDARKQNQIQFVSSVIVHFKDSEKEQRLCHKLASSRIIWKEEPVFTLTKGSLPLKHPIYVAGFGPAGIFCAYLLAKEGYRPVVIERGYDVDRRVQAVNRFWSEGTLDPVSNVQFGEGGAGTFSDGKLTTRISDPRCHYILSLLHQFGAPEEILTKAKPHIGTDKLRGVIKRLREKIISLGGQVLFEHKLERIHLKNGSVCAITVNGQTIPTENLVLAVGHSARDTFAMLEEERILLEPKSFSVGVRIEHLQQKINEGLYGKAAGNPNLPVGEYQLSYRENGRGVYTFCMCPGGMVVPSSSSSESVVTNGMSEYLRNQKNANSAVVVSVGPEDFGAHPLDGMRFQQRLEHKAFLAGGSSYAAPGACVGDFLSGKSGLSLKQVQPSYALGVVPCELRTLFPSSVSQMLEKGLRLFDRKIRGFAAPDAVLTGVETRTSSPVRITRREDYHSLSCTGLYPCGEGAGYAGGIMSAAADGLRVAQQIISTYQSE